MAEKLQEMSAAGTIAEKTTNDKKRVAGAKRKNGKRSGMPNRAERRAASRHINDGKYRGKSMLANLGEKLRDSIEMGKMIHEAHINEISLSQMREESRLDESRLAYFIETYGETVGREKFYECKRRRDNAFYKK